MTIASTTSRVSYTGDGATMSFSVPFYFQVNSDLVAFLQDALGNTTLQTLGTNYTLVGATLAGGGTMTFLVAPPTGNIVSIYRDPSLTQTTSYNNNDPFPAKSHELALDKACTIDQRTRDIALRSLRIPDAEANTTVTTLANIATRKNRLLGFDGNGGVVYVIGPTFVGNTSTGVAEVDSRSTAQTLTFSLSVNIVQTHGGVSFGDGFGLDYVRGTSGSPTPFQDGSGVFWTPATVQTGVPYANLTGVPVLIAAPNSIWSTGDVKLTLKNVADPLWVLFDDTTFGSATSGASGRQNADTQNLFNLLYASPFTDGNIPILTSAGGATTRGAQGTAAAAWAANCRMTLPKTLGRALAISGSGSGLTARALGAIVGTETVALSTSNLPAYTPAGSITVVNGAITTTSTTAGLSLSNPGGVGLVAQAGTGFPPVAISISSSSTQATTTATFAGTAQGGTAVPVSIMQPTTFLNAMIKL